MTKDQTKWTEISIAYETEPEERTERQKKLTHCGLCYAARQQRLWSTKDDTFSELPYINLPIIASRAGDESAWWETNLPRPDFYRATFAAFMAALSVKDIKEMIG